MSPLQLMVLSNVLNVAVLAFLLWKFALPRISSGLENKKNTIVQSLDETEKNLADINTSLDQVRREIQAASGQIGTIREEAASRSETAVAKIKSDTEQEISHLQERVERQIAQEFSSLRVRVRQDLISEIMSQAENMVRQRTSEQQQADVIENFAYSLKGFKEYRS
ncbi:MAG: hypothetical protein ACO1RX_09655 [Candidatus Sericytochromatia bacterium]